MISYFTLEKKVRDEAVLLHKDGKSVYTDRKVVYTEHGGGRERVSFTDHCPCCGMRMGRNVELGLNPLKIDDRTVVCLQCFRTRQHTKPKCDWAFPDLPVEHPYSCGRLILCAHCQKEFRTEGSGMTCSKKCGLAYRGKVLRDNNAIRRDGLV